MHAASSSLVTARPGPAREAGIRAGHDRATLAEIFPETATDGAAAGFALAHLRADKGPVLWIQDRLSRRETGRPYLAGMGARFEVILLEVGRPVDVLWAMEQGLSCTALGGVIGEIWGEAAAIDFTATKRLALRAEAQGTACWLIRRAARADLSAARERWRIASRPSSPHPEDPQAPGRPLWRATLFRARTRAPGTWDIGWSPATGPQPLAGQEGWITPPPAPPRIAALAQSA